MEYRMQYLTWMEFKRRKEGTNTVIIPSGAVEVYGPHLPLGTDIIVAKKISALVAKRSGGLVAPCLEIGNSNALYSFPGTLYCQPETLKTVYRDLCESLIKWGFRHIFVINTHRNNVAPLDDLLLDLQNEYNVICGMVPWWQYLPSISTDIFTTPNPQNHASEAATSVMLHLAPELVQMDKACATESKLSTAFPNIMQYISYDRLTDTGMLGDALAATAQKGEIVVGRAIEEMTKYILLIEKKLSDRMG